MSDDDDAAQYQAMMARARAKQAARVSEPDDFGMPEIAFTSAHVPPPAFALKSAAPRTKLVYVMDGADAARARANYARFPGVGAGGRGGTYGRGGTGNRTQRLAASFTHDPVTLAGLVAIDIRRLEFLAANPQRTDLLRRFETQVHDQIKRDLDAAGRYAQFKQQVRDAWTLIEQIRKPIYDK